MRKRPGEKVWRPSLSEVRMRVRHPIRVVLNNVRSLFNVGSMFRTSDGARIDKIYLCGITGCPPDEEIEKTALGATLSVFWEYHSDARKLIMQLRGAGWTIVALERTYESIPYTELDPDAFPMCLIVGNEVSGVDDDLLELCDIVVEIPQYGWKQSLNVAVAYGIVVYHFVHVFQMYMDK